MPFSDNLVKCKHCGKLEEWDKMIWLNGSRWCPQCYIKERHRLDTQEGKHEENKVSIR